MHVCSMYSTPVMMRHSRDGAVVYDRGYGVAWEGDRDGRDDISSLKQVGMIADLGQQITQRIIT